MMTDILNAVGLVAVATLFGSMAFFSAVVAPHTFGTLDADTAGRYIRSIFPRYFLLIAVLAVIAAASLAVLRPIEAFVMALIAAGAIVSRQSLMPRINRHRDRATDGDMVSDRAFTRLHRITVCINGAQIIGAFAVLVLLATT